MDCTREIKENHPGGWRGGGRKVWDQKELEKFQEDKKYIVLTRAIVLPRHSFSEPEPLPVVQMERDCEDGIREIATVYHRLENLDYLKRRSTQGNY